jgi:hypothetical protein
MLYNTDFPGYFEPVRESKEASWWWVPPAPFPRSQGKLQQIHQESIGTQNTRKHLRSTAEKNQWNSRWRWVAQRGRWVAK